jgi:uncharacterized protein YecE (DUF72 family)/GNAT superfamily N-acetyltransferase
MTDATLHLGTCSWKYPSWRGLVYPDKTEDYLHEYSKHYDCVEVDQWFYSLFKGEVVLPELRTVVEYAASVLPGFRFGVKLPNALTLTHYPKTNDPNPYFLSPDLLRTFMRAIQPLNLGPLMLQFGFLNRQMMPSQKIFLNKLAQFVDQLPAGYTWCIETRNPNYLNADYFQFLRDHNLGHVWQQGYYMPSVFELYPRFADLLTDNVVIRLHGADREGIEERSRKKWSQITDPKDQELEQLAGMLKDLQARKKQVWAFTNNHYEGSAPLTIERIRSRLGMTPKPEDPSLQCREVKYGSPEYAATVKLRDQVLRKPLGLLFNEGQLNEEGLDFHLACYRGDRLVACLVLTLRTSTTIRMRQVAVTPDCQRQGIGRVLVRFAEKFAWERGYTEIMAHARESALPFYLKLGYWPAGPRFTEVGISHVEVQKRLVRA